MKTHTKWGTPRKISLKFLRCKRALCFPLKFSLNPLDRVEKVAKAQTTTRTDTDTQVGQKCTVRSYHWFMSTEHDTHSSSEGLKSGNKQDVARREL